MLPLLSEADALSKAGGQLAFISQDPHASPAKPRGPPGVPEPGVGVHTGDLHLWTTGLHERVSVYTRVRARAHTHTCSTAAREEGQMVSNLQIQFLWPFIICGCRQGLQVSSKTSCSLFSAQGTRSSDFLCRGRPCGTLRSYYNLELVSQLQPPRPTRKRMWLLASDGGHQPGKDLRHWGSG